MSEAVTGPARRPRRRGLSVRFGLVLVLVLGGGLGWYLYQVRVQREVVARILRGGGTVHYPWDKPLPPFCEGLVDADRGWLPGPPQRWIDRLGPDWFSPLLVVCTGPSVTDEDVRRLGQLSGLRAIADAPDRPLTDANLRDLASLGDLQVIDLSGPYTAAGLSVMAHFPALKDLRVQNAALDDEGATYLGCLGRLEALSVSGKGLSDQGLRQIARLRRLERLFLPDLGVEDLTPLATLVQLDSLGLERASLTDDGVCALAPLHGLEYLVLNDTPLTDRGLACIARSFWNLRTLYIAGTPTRGEALAGLANLPDLEYLSLARTGIADPALQGLSGCARLRYLMLGRTAIGDQGVAWLRTLPDLQELHLDQTNLSDEGLRGLTEFPSLKGVGITPGICSVAGIDAARSTKLHVVVLEPYP